MKTLVLYYSRTGTTKKLANEIASKIKADIEEIIDTKNRKGIIDYIFSGRDAMRKKLTKINELKKDLKKYDLLIIGTPVWGHNLTPAIRTLLTKIKDYNKKAAFFCTMSSSGAKNTFDEMKRLLPNSKVIATLAVATIDIKKQEKINDFIKKIK